MEKIFTQEELFWLDDILPGTKIGRIRRLSAARNVHMPKARDDYNYETVTVSIRANIVLLVCLTEKQ